jgi:hypothetical protein
MTYRRIARIPSMGSVAMLCGLMLSDACGPTDLTRIAQLHQRALATAKLDDAVAAGGGDIQQVESEWTTLHQDYAALVKELPARSSELNPDLALIDKRLGLLRDERSYASRIALRNLHRDSGTVGPLGLPAEGVFGEVANTGQRVVALLQLRIDLIDNGGRAVGNVTAKAVTPGEGQPIAPGATRAFGVAVGHPGAVWTSARGSVTLLRLSRDGLRLPGEH